MRASRSAAVLCALAASAFLAFRLGTTQNVSDESTDVDDSSCHDLMRLFTGGATRISAKFWTELTGSSDDDWPELVKMLEQFARERDWSFRNASESRPGIVEVWRVSICAPDQPMIRINEQRWSGRDNVDEPLPPQRTTIGFSILGDVPEAVWQPAAADLVAMLEERWPNRVRFRDQNSNPTDRRPDFLHPKP